MSTLTIVLEPDADGTVHVPVPEELRHEKVRVVVSLESAKEATPGRKLPFPPATPEMIEKRMAAFQALRALGGLKHVIPDPVEWQREIRKDRPLPGRE